VPAPADLSEAALVEAREQELLDDLVAVQKKKRRHALWALLGLSPAAVIPAVGLFMEGSVGLFVLLCVLVTATQFIGWIKSMKREEELEEALRRLHEEA
jgi:hypothetical protein